MLGRFDEGVGIAALANLVPHLHGDSRGVPQVEDKFVEVEDRECPGQSGVDPSDEAHGRSLGEE
jgi:hypothetical protein